MDRIFKLDLILSTKFQVDIELYSIEFHAFYCNVKNKFETVEYIAVLGVICFSNIVTYEQRWAKSLGFSDFENQNQNHPKRVILKSKVKSLENSDFDQNHSNH